MPVGDTLLDAFVEQRIGGQHPFTPAMKTATPGDIRKIKSNPRVIPSASRSQKGTKKLAGE